MTLGSSFQRLLFAPRHTPLPQVEADLLKRMEVISKVDEPVCGGAQEKRQSPYLRENVLQ